MYLSSVVVRTSLFRSLICLACLVGIAACGFGSDDADPTVTSTQVPVDGATATTASPSATTSASPTVASTPTSTATANLPTATPHPTVAAEDLVPSTRLAYFHTTAEGGDSPQTVSELAQFVILTYGDEAFRDELRVAGYDGTILQYLNSSQVNGPGPYLDSQAECDRTFRPRRNGIARDPGAFCAEIHPNEDWFLHNGAGERLYTVGNSSGVWYHMNPGNEAWRAYASQAIAGDIIGPTSNGYDGAFLDNVELSLTKQKLQVSNADGIVQEFDNDEDYQAAWRDYLRQIRVRVGSGTLIWVAFVSDPNRPGIWAGYLNNVDGVMSPAFATGYDPLSVEKWNVNVSQAAEVVASGKGLIAVGRGPQADLDLQAFSLASYLLVADGEQAFFRYLSEDLKDLMNTIWVYPNYEIKLGAPLGARERVNGVWRREFQCGYVEANPAERTGEIVETACSTESKP